jgi:translation initiation factor 5A
MLPSLSEPFVTNANYTMIDYNEEGFATLIDESGETREDLKLDPEGNTHARHAELVKAFREVGEVEVKVVKSMGIEMMFPTTG